MPYVNVQITRGATRVQKQQLVADITQSLVQRLGKKPEHIHIVIDEVETDNWGFAGVLTTDYLAAQKTVSDGGSRGTDGAATSDA
jgi:4-oxalocrotonate tautomerase